MLERLFQLQAHGTTVRKEVVAGITTFLTMAYIIVVNPSILSSTGMDFGAVFVATCLAAVIGTPDHGALGQLPDRSGAGHGIERLFLLYGRWQHGLQLADSVRSGVHFRLPVLPAEHFQGPRMDH